MTTEERQLNALCEYHRNHLLFAPDSERDNIVRHCHLLSAIRRRPEGESIFRVLVHRPGGADILRTFAR